MLSIFPDLLTYNLIGITIIRVFVGFIGVYIGLRILSKRNQLVDYITAMKIPLAQMMPWLLIILFFISGGLMIIGLYTQIACIILAYLFLKVLFIDWFTNKIVGFDNVFYFAFIFISLSFLFLGAGGFAFDLPF